MGPIFWHNEAWKRIYRQFTKTQVKVVEGQGQFQGHRRLDQGHAKLGQGHRTRSRSQGQDGACLQNRTDFLAQL
jgi:hypothetical protein